MNEPALQAPSSGTSVARIALRVAFHEHRPILTTGLVGAALLVLLDLAAFQTLLISPQLIILGIVVYAAFCYRDARMRFMREFGTARGLSYTQDAPMSSVSGRLFDVGSDRTITQVLTGTLKGRPIRLFNYSYETGQGKHTETHRFTVMELVLPRNDFPPLMLRSREMLHGQLADEILHLNFQTIEMKGNDVPLEPTFAEHFELLVTPGYENEALEIFSPEILSTLAATGSDYSIEFSKNAMYIYDAAWLGTERSLSALYDVARSLFKALAPLLDRMRDDFDSLRPYYAHEA